LCFDLDAIIRLPHMKQSRLSRAGNDMTDTAAFTRLSIPLGLANRGFRGRINEIQVSEDTHGLAAGEIENRLLELGFVEGAEITILHEGPIGRDPIAVRINETTIALRRREAMAIMVISSKLSA
jgi:ferrous iron transport protein A